MSAIGNEVLDYWLAAERDWITFDVLAAASRTPVENLCFTAQQYIEKLLKAALTLHGVPFRRTHDILTLAEQLLASGSSPPAAREMLRKLAPCAVVARYQGAPIIDVDRDELLAIVAQARHWAEQLRVKHSLP